MPRCPVCDSEIRDGQLPNDVEVADLVQRIPMRQAEARVFLALWDAKGRVLTKSVLLDLFEAWRYEPSDTALSTTLKRLRQTIKDRALPLNLKVIPSIGWLLQRPSDWHWRDLKTDFELLLEKDDFDFKEM